MTRSIFAILAAMLAASVSLAGAAQGSANNTQASKKMSATGIVMSVSSASLVIEGNEKHSITFAVDSTTRILARGRITKIRPAIGTPGPKITDVLHRGDLITVSFYLTGTALHADEVRVVRQALR
jgi:hypothetical protein